MAIRKNTPKNRAKSAASESNRLPFGIPAGKAAKVPYVDEDRDCVDSIVAGAIDGAIEMLANHFDPDLVEDILRLARDRLASERKQIRYTAYTGEVTHV